MANTLFIRLEGPMQSWGERSRWSERDTAPEPTKSGVVGLLACALGWSQDEDLRRLSRAICLGVRCDRPGQALMDYHTIVGGVLSAAGKLVSHGLITYRMYLFDASFLVAVQSDPDWISRLEQALREPIWPIYLGRKSCIPARPLLEGSGDFDTLESALRSIPLGQKDQKVRTVLEALPGQGIRRRDEIDSRSLRTYLPRYTREVMLDIPGGKT